MGTSAAATRVAAHLTPERLAPTAALLGAHIAVSAVLDASVAGTGHDQRTLDLLVRLALGPEEGERAVNISEQLMVSPSHLSRVIDRVEAAGLITRTPDPSDRRANLLVLTPAGIDVLDQIAPRLAATLDRVVHDTLTASEIETLVDLLGKLETAARATPLD